MDEPHQLSAKGRSMTVKRFAPPYNWTEIDAAVSEYGFAVIEQALTQADVAVLNKELDSYLAEHPGAGGPQTAFDQLDKGLGYRTIRLHGLCAKLPSASIAVGHKEVIEWGSRLMTGQPEGALLAAGEFISISPSELAQGWHRDTNGWPVPSTPERPSSVDAIFALTKFTAENGATRLAPGSHLWDRERRPSSFNFVPATMNAGDALLFNGDVVHFGGANRTRNEHRRAISLLMCAPYLRPVENSQLNISVEQAAKLPEHVRRFLGFGMSNTFGANGGAMLGLYENGDPARLFEATGG
jgi:hypothetical protein